MMYIVLTMLALFNPILAAVDSTGETPPSLVQEQIIDSSKINIPEVQADQNTLRNVLNYVFVAVGAISVLMVVIGGIRYIISAGNPQQAATAKNTVIYALVGLIISLSAFIIVGFIFDAVSDNPTSKSIGYIGSSLV